MKTSPVEAPAVRKTSPAEVPTEVQAYPTHHDPPYPPQGICLPTWWPGSTGAPRLPPLHALAVEVGPR